METPPRPTNVAGTARSGCSSFNVAVAGTQSAASVATTRIGNTSRLPQLLSFTGSPPDRCLRSGPHSRSQRRLDGRIRSVIGITPRENVTDVIALRGGRRPGPGPAGVDAGGLRSGRFGPTRTPGGTPCRVSCRTVRSRSTTSSTGPRRSSRRRRSSPPRQRASSGRPTASGPARARRLGGVLDDLGISADGRVATFAWNTARHLELYFAAPCSGRVLHTLNIRLFPEQVTYIVNHAEDEVIFVDRSLIGAAVAAARHLRDGAPHRGDGRRSGRGAEPRRRSGAPRLRGPAGRGRPDRVAPAGREPGRVDVLHERHHRQPQGRRLLAPLDLAAHRRRDDGRQPGRLRARHDPARRAHVPRQRLGPGPRRRGLRRQPVMPGPDLSPTGHRRPDRAREGHRGRRRAHHLDGRAARAQGPRHVAPAGHPVRRLGRAPAPVRGLPGDHRPARSCRPGA